MTPEEREMMNSICRRIQEEKDPERLSALVKELDQVFERKRTIPKASTPPSPTNQSLPCS